MTLIEVIGVLAVIAILAAILLPALVKETDKIVADQETASLQSFGNAFQSYVMRNRRIPGTNNFDWATNIAAELGVSVGSVTNNVRQQPRVFLIDPSGFGSTTLPYVQNNTGTALPNNPRLMIVSSLGKPLPSGLVSGAPSTNDFNNLWNSTLGTVPTTGVWAGWRTTGNPNDIMVQRINLSPLFVNLLLSTYNSTWSGYYSIDGAANSPVTNLVSNYFLQNSILSLSFTNPIANAGSQDSQQLLIRNSSFVFYGNEWVRSIGGTNAVVSGSGSGGTGTNSGSFNFSSLINGFLSANPTSLGSSQQTNLTQSFMNYMSNYDAWAAETNFPNFSSTNYANAVRAQTNMVGILNNLMNAINLNVNP